MAAVAADVLIPAANLTPKWRRPRRPAPLGELSDDERRELEEIEGELEFMGIDRRRPRTRAECPPAGEVCPWIGCRHHLAIDITSTGKVKMRFPNLEIWEMRETCSLRVADAGGMSIDETAPFLGITRGQISLDERRALAKMRQGLERQPRRTPKR